MSDVIDVISLHVSDVTDVISLHPSGVNSTISDRNVSDLFDVRDAFGLCSVFNCPSTSG